MARVIYLHTVLSVARQFDELSRALLPVGTEWWHIADEILAKVVLAQGGLSPAIHRRVAAHVQAAQDAGADVIQLTCSSISPCVDVVRSLATIPVLKIDDPMVEQALSGAPSAAQGGAGPACRIGIAATAPTALAPLAALLETQATAAGRRVEVDPVLCEGAYQYLVSGDLERHDRIVRDTLAQMTARDDVIMLAQASMARVVDTLPAAGRPVPILASPRPAVERLAALLARA